MKSEIEIIWEIIRLSEHIAIYERDIEQGLMQCCNLETEAIRTRELEQKSEELKKLKGGRSGLLWLFDDGEIKE